MAVSNLNVRVGFLFDEKGLKQIERQMRSAGQRLSSIGDKLAFSISAPLAAIGISAIKAAGDMEALRLAMRATFEQGGRSAAAADAELEKLRESAKAPGLDFEQAVRGSVRLQNVGFQAEKARKIIEQLANAVATTGGTAQDLDEVTHQFTQMIGKGKIFQDDLKIILGRMPVLAGLMKETFGTTTAEGLNALGVDAREFVDKMTAKMAELPRVTGGIANAIVNAGSAIRNFLASVGDTLNKTLGVTGKLDAFSAALTNLGKWFQNLDDGTRRVIVSVATFALVLGPAIKASNLLVQAGVKLFTTWKTMSNVFQQWLILSSNPEAKTGLISWFTKLNLATRLTIIGAAIGIVLAVAAAFLVLSKNMSAAAQAARKVEESQKAALDSISQERAQIELLTSVAKDKSKTDKERVAAVNELIKINPAYRSAIKGEIIDTVELDKVTGNLIETMIRAATVRQATNDIAEIDNQLRNLGESSAPTTLQTIGNLVLSMGHSWGFANRQAHTAISNMDEARAALLAQRDALNAVAKANFDLGKTPPGGGGGGNSDAFKKRLETYKEVLSDIANVSAQQDLLGSENIIEQAEAIEGGIKKLLDAGFKPMSKEVQGLKTQLQGLFSGVEIGADFAPLPTLPTPQAVQSVTPSGTDALVQGLKVATPAMQQFLSVSQQLGAANMAFQGGLVMFGETFQTVSDIVTANGTLMQQVFVGIGDAMQESAAAGASSFGELAGAAAQAAGKIVRAWIQQGVAATVAKALGSLPFPFNLAAGAAAGALAGALFTKALGAIKVPGFAKGTNFAPGGLSLVGEKGPELVNLPRGSKVTPNAGLSAMLSQNAADFTLTHRISGSDLLFIVERAQAQSKRIRGF